MKTVIQAAALSLLLSTTLTAQSTLSGKWQGDTGNRASIVLDLTVKQATLTGTLTRNEQQGTITDGKVSKNRFTFRATINDQPEAFTGEITNNELKIWLDRQGPERAVVLKRVERGAQSPGR